MEKRLVTRYAMRSADAADENQRRVEGVFAELAAAKPDNVSYLVLRLADDSFVHVSFHDHREDEPNPIASTAAFAHFQDEHAERRDGGVDQQTASSYGYRADDTGTATWSGSVASQITTYAGRARKAHPASTPARPSGSCGASSAPGGSEATPLGSCLAFATSICAATSPDAETRRKDAPLGFFDDLVLDTDQCYLFTLEPGVPDLDVTRLPKPLANLFRRHAHT